MRVYPIEQYRCAECHAPLKSLLVLGEKGKIPYIVYSHKIYVSSPCPQKDEKFIVFLDALIEDR